MRNSYVAKKIREMPSSGIRKFFDVANTMKGVISLGVGEPDFETPWHVRESAIISLERGKTAYSANQGLIELRKSIADYLKERFQLDYDAKHQILVTVGASEGIDLAMRALIDPGDEVLVVEPSFVSYKPCIAMAGGIPIVIDTKAEHEFRLMPEELEKKITSKTKVILLPFPNNPTGAIMEKEDLEAIAKIVIEHDLFVVSDEIYAELTYGSNHFSIASIPGMKERTVILNGFSKAFAMTGWRLGYACGPEEIIYNMNKIHQYIIMCAPTTSQFAGVEAMVNERRDEEIDIMREAYDERRRVLVNGFRQMGLDCFEPKGAFYVFPSIQKTGLSSEAFCDALLQSQKVAVVPGNAFGESGEGFIRCSYAYSIDSLKESLRRIALFVESLKS